MNRINWQWLILNSIFLIVFNVFFFTLKSSLNNCNSAWIPFGFIHIAYIVLLATPLFVRLGKFSVDYGRPLFLISSLYFLAVLIIGFIFIGININTTTISWLTYIGLSGVFAVWFIGNLVANEHTVNSIERHEEELLYVKITSSQLKAIMNMISDSKARKNIEYLYDYIHSSPIKSSPNALGIEREIKHEIDNLFNSVNLADNIFIVEKTNKILQLAMERNRVLGN